MFAPPQHEKQTVPGNLQVPFISVLIIPFVAVLASGLRLLAALDAGALIMLSAPNLGQDSGLRAAALKTLQRAVQRLVLFYVNF